MWVVHRQGQGWAVTDALAVAFAHPIADKSQDVVLRSMEFKDGEPQQHVQPLHCGMCRAHNKPIRRIHAQHCKRAASTCQTGVSDSPTAAAHMQLRCYAVQQQQQHIHKEISAAATC
jgi:hypothetical protein